MTSTVKYILASARLPDRFDRGL